MKRKRWDIYLILILVIIAVISVVFVNFFYKTEGEFVQVIIEDDVIYEYSLDNSGTYPISNGDNHNVMVINNREVWVESADCNDLICVKQGKISKGGESIICLPHKLVICIVTDDELELDAISN